MAGVKRDGDTASRDGRHAHATIGKEPWAGTSLLVVQIGPAESLDSGANVYRTVQPCRALGELPDVAAVSGSTLSPALFENDLLLAADVLILRNVADPDLFPILAARRQRRRVSVYELDRQISAVAIADGTSTAAAHAGAPDLAIRSVAPALARHADAIQVASAALARHIASLNPRRAIFPSQLWDAPPLPPVRRVEEVVIGWAGSPAHHDDLRAIAPTLARVLERHPGVRVAIMGEEGARQALSGLPPDRVSHTHWGTLAEYYQFLAGVQIGIAPLAPTPFNRLLGDIKFVELAAHGVMPVCADLEPYGEVVRRDRTGLLFSDSGELEAVLERGLADPELRASVAAQAARYATAERLERHHVAARLGFYLSVAAQAGARLGSEAARPPNGAGARAERVAPHHPRRSFPHSRYDAFGEGAVDRLLAEGEVSLRAGDLAAARRAFQAAAELAPQSHLPQLMLAKVEPPAAAVETLLRAEALYPMSCQAAYLRGAKLLELGATGEAVAAFESARAIAPSFAAPQERLGAIAEAAGRLDDACRLYEDAALQNSFFALPIARLATLAQRAGKLEKAVALLERSIDEDPDLWLTNFLIGRTYVDLKRFHQARSHLQRALECAAEDRPAVLTELAKAELGLGNLNAARHALQEARQKV